MNIRLLPQNLINQIAAGEVVERPASAVKELVENAIDANATYIVVDIIDGGKDLIVVTDNGKGMSKDDLSLAVERHATSKLPKGDLMAIATMGFRGEALPSLGAISRLSLTSRTENETHAWKITIEGGDRSEPQPASHAIGTRVEIKDLFFATPARLKFLKTTTTESNHIAEIMERLALANPSIHFTLRDTKRTIFDFPKTDNVLERLTQIYGKEFKENTVFVIGERDDYKIEGYVGLPTYSRNAGTMQQFFVNKRSVKDKILSHALRLSYHDLLARDRFPVAFLYLTIPNREVDVNVHPAKSEVRFLDSGLVRGLMISSIKAALHQQGHQSAPIITDFALSKFKQEPTTLKQESSEIPERQHVGSSFFSTSKNEAPKTSVQESFKLNSFRAAPSFVTKNNIYEATINQDETEIVQFKPENFPENYVEHLSLEINDDMKLGRPLAQLHQNYILCQTSNGFLLVDQHAAHERIKYEQLKNNLLSQKLPRQALLIPEIIEVSSQEKALLLNAAEHLESLGLKIEPFGDDAIILRETPAILGEINAQKLIFDIIDELKTLEEPLHLKEKILDILSTYACHHSVRSGQKLSISEMNHLLRDMEQTLFSGQCNHGRPTYIELTLSDIEKLFGRR
ncbi:MAG: DNA mismatch repair endonuclease MutL [Alphaproteobacteria bacterium]|nr:DNA mismatch repair endonuclease MutL [Alphaproteobacteria bacterium]